MSRLLVGTEKGLELLMERATGWDCEWTQLQGTEVSAILKRGGGRLLVGTRQSGLFALDPARGSAEPVGASVLPKGVRCIAVSPQNPDCLYVGFEPTAIFKSIDGGRSWQECREAAAIGISRGWKYPVPFIAPHIRHILVDRVEPRRVYAAAQVGGVLRSEDGGETWQDVVDGIDPDVHAIAQDPQRPETLYASTGGGGRIGELEPPPPPRGYPLYRSDDAGRTWRNISATFTRRHSVPIHVYPREPSTLVAAVASGSPGKWRARPEGADAVLLASRDSGAHWERIENGLPQTFPIMVEAIETDPADGRVYLGIGGEGTKIMPAEKRHGAIYYADRLDGPWRALPRIFPPICALTPV
jgi:hypothetical protein